LNLSYPEPDGIDQLIQIIDNPLIKTVELVSLFERDLFVGG
jgi:hypothetical protein